MLQLTTTNEESQPNSDQLLRNALTDIENYLADNFGTQPSSMTYKEYSNGISLTSDNPTFSTAVVILTQSNGTLNLPDNVILLGYVKTDKGDDYHIKYLGNFITYLIKLGTTRSDEHRHAPRHPTPRHRLLHRALRLPQHHPISRCNLPPLLIPHFNPRPDKKFSSCRSLN